MALGHAVLANLLYGDASGYELAKRFDVSVANFWHALPQQVYGELRRLEGDGLVDGRDVEQSGRPNKRVYRITDAGRQRLRAFSTEPSRPTSIKDDLLVKVHACAATDRPALIRELRDRAAQCERKAERYRHLRDGIADPGGDGLGADLTVEAGIEFELSLASWCRRAAARLDGR